MYTTQQTNPSHTNTQAQLPAVSTPRQMVVTPELEALLNPQFQLPVRPRKTAPSMSVDPSIVKMGIACGALVAITAIVMNSLPNKTTSNLIQSQMATNKELSDQLITLTQEPKKVSYCIMFCSDDNQDQQQRTIPDPSPEPPIDYASTQQTQQPNWFNQDPIVVVDGQPVSVPTGY